MFHANIVQDVVEKKEQHVFLKKALRHEMTFCVQ